MDTTLSDWFTSNTRMGIDVIMTWKQKSHTNSIIMFNFHNVRGSKFKCKVIINNKFLYLKKEK